MSQIISSELPKSLKWFRPRTLSSQVWESALPWHRGKSIGSPGVPGVLCFANRFTTCRLNTQSVKGKVALKKLLWDAVRCSCYCFPGWSLPNTTHQSPIDQTSSGAAPHSRHAQPALPHDAAVIWSGCLLEVQPGVSAISTITLRIHRWVCRPSSCKRLVTNKNRPTSTNINQPPNQSSTQL